MAIRKVILVVLAGITPMLLKAQKVVPIYPSAAPGSANWNWHEQQTDPKTSGGVSIAYNVVKPTLTVYPANAATANGTSVIVCPGGGFFVLSMDNEGTEVAHWLNQKGVTVFILKYRLIHTVTPNPGQEFLAALRDSAKLNSLYHTELPLAMADGKQAITWVRSHAIEYHINPHKIGIIGFSAGGTVSSSTAFNYAPQNRPDFVAAIYGYVPDGYFGTPAADAPPLFLAAATDDQLHLVPSSIGLYTKWLSSGHQAELHIYAKGGHGFGMNKQHLPVDTWTDRFSDWLKFNKYIR